MVIIREATENDKEGWNRVALESENATYAHTWQWKEVLEKGLDVETFYLLAEDRDEVIGIYPGFLSPIKTKNIFLKRCKTLFSPLDTTWDYGGPCILPNTSKKVLEELVKSMEKFAEKKGVISLRISPFENTILTNILIHGNYRFSSRKTSIIDLTKSEEELWKNLNRKTRSQVRQAKRKGLSVTEENDEKALENFYGCMKDVAEGRDFYLPPFSFYRKLHEVLHPHKMVRIYLVKYNERVICSSLCLYFKDTMVTRWWGAHPKFLNLRPYNILMWTHIEEGKQLGYKKCDLGGMPPNEKNGVYKFKAGWGGELKNVDWYVKDIRFGKIRELKRRISLTSGR